jgi:zinc transport system substrate-binding protein
MRSREYGTTVPLCRAAVLIGVILLAAVMAGCTDGQQTETGSPITTVVVTIPPQAEFVERIGGDHVRVVLMVPPGNDPHTYEPTSGQLAEVAGADMYAAVGSGIEFERAWLEKIAGLNSDMLIVDCSRGIDLIEGDPHIWLSPKNAKIMVENICQGLIQVDPENTDEYRRNADAYLQELDALDAEIARSLEAMQTRKIMVYHASWGYLARDYGLVEISIESEGKEPTPQGIERLIEEARSENISVIFAEPEFSTRSAEVIAHEINGTVVLVSPLKKEYLENMRQVAAAFAGSEA